MSRATVNNTVKRLISSYLLIPTLPTGAFAYKVTKPRSCRYFPD
jgi:hypothetical protein